MFRRSAATALRSLGRLGRSGAPAALVTNRCQSTVGCALSSSSSAWGYNGAAILAGFAATLAWNQEAHASTPQERSFIMIKPDGVQRALVSEIISRFERKGFKLVGIKVVIPGKDLAQSHYAEHNGRPFFPKLVSFLASGAVVAMVWEGKDVIKYGRSMIGATNPMASAPGTIRGDLGIDVGRNIIHGSDSVESPGGLWYTGSHPPHGNAPGTIRGDLGIDVGRYIIHGSDSVEQLTSKDSCLKVVV
eukprot:gene11578-34278_t